MNTARPIRIATRASRLALWQSEHVSGLLNAAAPERDVEIVTVSTRGDRDRQEPLYQLGGLGVFTREVQQAVLDGRADLAVHSLKDLPTESAPGLVLAAVPQRASTDDVLVLPRGRACPEDGAESLAQLPAGARIGTGSLRRAAQVRYHRHDLEAADVRGNVETRLQKLDDGQFDALVLAAAGLERLGLEDRISARLVPPVLYPAVGQGALGIECRQDDAALRELLHEICDETDVAAVTAERSLLHQLRAGCHAPVGVSSRVEDGALLLEAVVLSADGRQRLSASAGGTSDAASAIGIELAEMLLEQGARELIDPSEG